VRLEDTLFYPTSGGQPHDTGTLAGAAVVDVKVAGGEVWHLVEGRPERGARVAGALDWPRRYRHMQRHSAQHLLSQAFWRLTPPFETRAVNLSGPVCTLDLAGAPSADDATRAETSALEAMYAALAVTTFEVAERELGRYPLRRPPKVAGRVRLVQMGDFELSACGGTHVRCTSEALPLKVLRLERVRGLTRVHFVAGWEAQADYFSKHLLVTELAARFSAHPNDVGARVSALQAALHDLQRDLAAARQLLAEGLAERLSQSATDGVVCHLLGHDQTDLLAPLARRLTEWGLTALLAAPHQDRVQLLFMRPTEGKGDLRDALHAALPLIHGRGGGSPARAQGSGPGVAHARAALEAAFALVSPSAGPSQPSSVEPL
jgi:alanyl-tRNA synthetase